MTKLYLAEYYAEIEAGRILVGQELQAELENLMRDLSNPRYVYDTADAERRMRFIEGCVRLTKSPFYGKPMKLILWQKAFLEALYSFKMADMGYDRFKEALLLCARKNGKTEFCSGVTLGELIEGEPGEDLVLGSNDDSQASILYDSVDTMRLMIDPDQLDTHKNNRWIKNKMNNSKIFKLSQRTVNKEGRGVDFAILDEVHEMRNNSLPKAVEQSQSAKDNPKQIEITTEGFTNGGYLDNLLVYARKVIAGEIDDEASERFLPWLYTQDDENEIFRSEATWQKSNPSLDVIKKRSYLRGQIAKARESKADRVFVLCKDYNIKQNNATAWLSAEDYEYPAVFSLEDFRGAVCLGAVDLSETTDLTCAKILLMRPGDETKYVHTQYFIPEAKQEQSPDDAAGAKYEQWANEGWLTVLPGNDIDLTLVADWYYGLYDRYDLRPFMVGYDQKFAKQFLRRMADYGIETEMINQNAETLTNAVKLVEAELQSKKINYQENPIDRWCLGHAAIKVNNLGQALLVKPQNRAAFRIDGAVCLAILLEVFRRYRSEFLAAVGTD